MPRKLTGTWKRSGQGYLVLVTLPASFAPGRSGKDRRLPGIPVAEMVNGRKVTDADLDRLARTYAEQPDLAIRQLALLGKLPSWVPLVHVPKDALQIGAQANPIAANTPGAMVETVAAYAERWLKWRDGQGYSTIDRDQSVIDNHINPFALENGVTLGQTPIVAVTRAHCKAFAKHLQDKARSGELMQNSAARYWRVLTSLMKATANDDEAALYVREDDPALGVKGPAPAAKSERGCLYPDEFLRLMNCERIPLAHRRCIALVVYLQLRLSEIRRIRCEDIDLEHEIVNVRRAWDTYRRKEKAPKNGKSRRFEIHPNLIPLLRVMIAERGGKGLLLDVNPEWVSDAFQRYLDLAGLDRWELRNHTANNINCTFHGLRSTGATWTARIESNPLKLRATLGHSDQKTTDRYIETAQLLGRNIGQVFPPLPSILLDSNRSVNCPASTKAASIQMKRSQRSEAKLERGPGGEALRFPDKHTLRVCHDKLLELRFDDCQLRASRYHCRHGNLPR